MLRLPEKHSKKWLGLTALLALTVFIAILLAMLLFGASVKFTSLLGFALIALLTAAISGVGGYLGARIFSAVTIAATLAGVLYMLFTVIFRTGDGWSDLTGLLNFLTLTVFGILAGIVLQVLVFFVGIKKRKRAVSEEKSNAKTDTDENIEEN